MNLRQKIFTILTLLWMVVIFIFSAQPGEVSGGVSKWAGMVFAQIFVPGFEDWTVEKQDEFAIAIDYPVRKTAHFAEFAILGFFVAGVLIKKASYKKALVPWLIASFYAATDEFHQLFVPERAGMVKDALLDSCGAMAGVLVFILFYKMHKDKRENKQNSDLQDAHN
ncbi:MAG: VanZ family protein [Lachnospiraceae bacterium]|nr:VanZ family protein [Lachnospiraceae bacterium]